jgi:hypothetical protein
MTGFAVTVGAMLLFSAVMISVAILVLLYSFVRAGNEFFNTHVVHVSFLLYLVDSDGLVIVLSAEVFAGLFLSGREGGYVTKILKFPVLIYVLTNASRSGNTSRDLARSGHVVSPPLLGSMLQHVARVV